MSDTFLFMKRKRRLTGVVPAGGRGGPLGVAPTPLPRSRPEVFVWSVWSEVSQAIKIFVKYLPYLIKRGFFHPFINVFLGSPWTSVQSSPPNSRRWYAPSTGRNGRRLDLRYRPDTGLQSPPKEMGFNQISGYD